MSDQFDVILWGGTSFVGKLTAKHLLEVYGLDKGLRWAIGGRNEGKLRAFRATLGAEAAQLPLIVGDGLDASFVDEMVAKTKVVLTTVGPYRLYGQEVIRACAQQGKDYCDLAGEVVFVRNMRDRHHEAALESGARILSMCGVDSLPSDLGVWKLAQIAEERFGEKLRHVSTEVAAFKGAFSGGTIASMKQRNKDLQADPSLHRLLDDPYALCPDGRRQGVRQPSLTGVERSASSGRWLAPFVMASINTRIVHATNAMLDYPYGETFTYSEKMGFRNPLVAHGLARGIDAFEAAMNWAPTERFLSAKVLPKPGEGPSEKMQREGFFRFDLYGETEGGNRISLEVFGERDPGYGATARMIGETAKCLLDASKDELAGGFWTPAASIAAPLIARLEANAGMRFRERQ